MQLIPPDQLNEALELPGGAHLSGIVGCAYLHIDAREHARRVNTGLGAVTGLTALEILLDLPLGYDVPLSSIASAALRRLESLPGVAKVDRSGGVVHRLLTRPVIVVGVSTSLRPGCWRRALVRAATLRPAAPAWIDVEETPSDEQLLEADLVGVGVRDIATGWWLVAPAPIEHGPFKGARWRFEERAYSAWLEEQSLLF